MSNVLIALKDDGLGGTSLSSIAMGGVWASLGREVYFFNASGFHPSRRTLAQEVGHVLDTPLSAPNLNFEFVHLHHKAPSPTELRWIRELLHIVEPRTSALLTHNIFGTSIRGLIKWRKPWIEGALSPWVRAQIICGDFRMWLNQAKRPIVIPNPQFSQHDDGSISASEAKRKIGISPGARVILRIGSPIKEKWSSDYIHLARRAENYKYTLVLIGAPADLRKKVNSFNNCRVVDPIVDRVRLKTYYAAADVFAVSADRGESFGNVILEALAMGVPVVYRKARFRDNTPVQFKATTLFSYQIGRSRWIDECLRFSSTNTEEDEQLSTQRYVEENFSIRAVAQQVEGQLLSLRTSSSSRFLSLTDWAEVMVLHNPLCRFLKYARLVVPSASLRIRSLRSFAFSCMRGARG